MGGNGLSCYGRDMVVLCGVAVGGIGWVASVGGIGVIAVGGYSNGCCGEWLYLWRRRRWRRWRRWRVNVVMVLVCV